MGTTSEPGVKLDVAEVQPPRTPPSRILLQGSGVLPVELQDDVFLLDDGRKLETKRTLVTVKP